MSVLDFLEFSHEYVALPIKGSWHPFFEHYHLSFDREAGRTQFRERINRILARNNLVYELTEQGEVQRIAPPILRESLTQYTFATGDRELDTMLETARRKFLNPNPVVRRESLVL